MIKTILLVEDDPDDQKLIVIGLKDIGVANEIVIADDGQEALDYLFGTGVHAGRNVADCPALVILDLHLPRIDGLEVLRRVRADDRTKLQPIVILTSSDEEKDRLNSYGLGANSYARKPVDFDEFRDAVKKLKLYWLLVNIPPK